MTSILRAVVPLAVLMPFIATCASLQPRPYLVGNDRGTVDQRGNRVPIRCPGLAAVDTPGTGSDAVHDLTIPVSLAGEQARIPAYNDCQRLVLGDGDYYGPLVGIFASRWLDAITRPQFEQPGGMPVAQLYNFSDFPYPVLDIQPGYSCLYLRLNTSGQWEAHLGHMTTTDACPQLTQWPVGGPQLRVLQAAPAPGTQYPAVARWDWDPNHRRNYMAVRCLDSWCEIGAPPLYTSPIHGGHPTQGGKPSYDQQDLAVPNNAGQILPRVRGTIVPEPGLDTLDITDFTCDSPCADTAGWLRVATVHLITSGIDHYRTKMGFTQGANQMFVRRKTGTAREVWQTRIISADGAISYRRTLYGGHSIAVPATARWRWLHDDETTWIRCAPGCCESSDKTIAASDW